METPVTVTSAGRPDKESTKLEEVACDPAVFASLTATSMYKVVSLVRRLLFASARLQYVETPPKALAIESHT